MVTAVAVHEIRSGHVSDLDSYYTVGSAIGGEPTATATENGGSMFGTLGLPELLIIFAIVLVVFGASRLPQLGKGLGEGISNFRDGLRGRDEKKNIEGEKKPNA
jgi:sec-independent protein translocase protein TatA